MQLMEPRFTLYAHYRELPPSMGGGTPEGFARAGLEEGEACAFELTEELCYEDTLRLLEDDCWAMVDMLDRDHLEGFCLSRFSCRAQGPHDIRLSARMLRKLVRQKCFFSHSVCTERWMSSRHQLHAFFVISFPQSPELLPLPGELTPPGILPLVYREQPICVVGNNGSYSSLESCLRLLASRAASTPPSGTCRIDYLTTAPWVDLLITGRTLRCLAKLRTDLSIHVHHGMKTTPGDEMNNCFAYLIRHPEVRAFLNAQPR